MQEQLSPLPNSSQAGGQEAAAPLQTPASEPQAPAMYQSLISPEQPGDEADGEADFFLADRPARRRFFDDPDFTV